MKFTEKQLMENSPCKDGLDFAVSLNFNFKEIYEKCDRGDWLIWLLRKSKTIDKKQSVQIAISCAEKVLEIHENKNPKDLRPRNAIQAAKNWLENPTEENKNAANAAAYTAANATDAAVYAAVYAAAYAVYAAVYAAYAAYAADAVANAAYAADAAAYTAADAAEARKNARKWQADEIRKIVPNPFN